MPWSLQIEGNLQEAYNKINSYEFPDPTTEEEMETQENARATIISELDLLKRDPDMRLIISAGGRSDNTARGFSFTINLKGPEPRALVTNAPAFLGTYLGRA